MRPWYRAIFTAFVAALFSWGCTDPLWFGSTPKIDSRPMHEGWQYRYGDSPIGADGVPKWVQGAEPDEWKPLSFPDWAPVEKDGDHHLWQRVRLPVVSGGDQAIFIRGAWQIFEAYVDGKRRYHFGRFGPDGRGYFPGQAWHTIPVTNADSGKWIYFRSYSADKYVGLYEGVHIGSRHDHAVWMLRNDLPLMVMGSIYIFMGFVTVYIFSRNGERSNLSFGLFSIAIGLYEICRTYLKQYFFHDPLVWGSIELTSLYLVPVTFSLFVEDLFGSGPYKAVRRIWQVSLLFLAYSWAMMIIGGKPLWFSLYEFQYFLMGSSAFLLSVVGWIAYQGDKEARIFFLGFTMVVLAAIHDILRSMGLIYGIGVINHVGVFILVISLAIIVGRRVLQAVSIKKNLELASAVQNLLLPVEREGQFGDYDFSSYYEPYGRMAGDWMNFWKIGEGEMRLLFGDVVGKGPRAALAVAAIAAFIEDAKRDHLGVEDCIRRINEGLMELFGGHITTTLTAASLFGDGRVELYNCGGVGWMRFHQRVEHLLMPSSMLGLEGEILIGKKEIALSDGEILFGFTDGVIEGSRMVTKLSRVLDAYDPARVPFDVLFELANGCGLKIANDDRSILAIRRQARMAKAS